MRFAEMVGDHLYKVSFPFLGGSTVFEETLRAFKAEHPDEVIDRLHGPQPTEVEEGRRLDFLHLHRRLAMKSQRLIQGAILWFWTWGLSVADEILPDVQHLWVGRNFFALFVKFFASMGLKDPAFATAALAPSRNSRPSSLSFMPPH